MAASGTNQAVHFEKLFLKQRSAIRLSSGLWSRYMRGDVLPQGSLEGHKSSLVARLDKVYPGTGSIFYHPVWDLLDFDKILSPMDLQGCYLKLGASAYAKMTMFPAAMKVQQESEKIYFWRSQRNLQTRQSAWTAMRDLDGVAVCLIEARLDYLAQREDSFVQAILGAGTEFKRLADGPVFEWKKSKFVLLLMEAMTLRHALCLISEDPLLEKNRVDLCRSIDEWRKSWNARATSLLGELSGAEKSTFMSWLNQIKSKKSSG